MFRKRRRIGGDDVDVDSKAIGKQADRLLHALGAVNGVERGMGVEDDLAVAVDGASSGVQKLVDVRLLDLVAAKLDLDIGDVADNAAGAVACPHLLDSEARHALGELDGFANREFARRHVGDIAALDPPAFALAGAEHGQPAVVTGRGNQRAHLRRADVERGNQGLVGRLRHRGVA